MKPNERFYFEANNGGSYIVIQGTARPDVVHLEVGHDCVKVVDKDVNVYVIAEILAQAAEKGFDRVMADKFDDVPEWARPV